MTVYRKQFEPGLVEIDLRLNDINFKGVPMVVFVGADISQGSSPPQTCGGIEKVVSLKDGEFYKNCEASSSWSNWLCDHAFKAGNEDNSTEMWASNGQGVDAWIQINFKQSVMLQIMEFRNRRNPAERNKLLLLQFSDNSHQEFPVKNDYAMEKILIKPVITKFVKITIKEVYGTINNGGSFKFYGVECSNPESFVPSNEEQAKKLILNGGTENKFQYQPIFAFQDDSPVLAGCRDSYINSSKFSGKLNKEGNVTVKCPNSCHREKGNIFGSKFYSEDSVICKAAYHADVIPETGGSFIIKITSATKEPLVGLLYKGVTSKDKAASYYKLRFENLKPLDESNIIIKEGTKVDVRDSSNASKYIPYFILNSQTKNEQVILTLMKEGESGLGEKILSLSYPNQYVLPCGEKLFNRDCSNSRKEINTHRPLVILFGQQDSYVQNFNAYIDKGEEYGKTIKPIGWNLDMRERIRSKRPAIDVSNPIHSFVIFNPNKKSIFCANPTSGINCEESIWSAKVGKGKYKVRLTSAAVDKAYLVNFQINDKEVAQNSIVRKTEIKTFEATVQDQDEFIKVTARCEVNCSKAISILNKIEIAPEDPPRLPPKNKKIQDCGNSKSGLECDNTSEVENCIFDNLDHPGLGFCNDRLTLIQIPDNYKCKQQQGKLKCVRKVFDSTEQCLKFCPLGCVQNKCG